MVCDDFTSVKLNSGVSSAMVPSCSIGPGVAGGLCCRPCDCITNTQPGTSSAASSTQKPSRNNFLFLLKLLSQFISLAPSGYPVQSEPFHAATGPMYSQNV